MRAILAYDASAGAEVAASLVTATRWGSGSAVRVVAVVEPSAALVPGLPLAPARLVMSPEIEAQIVDYLEAEVARVVEQLRAAGVDADGEVLRGRPATVLVDEARRDAADLVVAGSRGRGPIASLVLGSVSAELVDHAPCPVLVARTTDLTRVVFATDGSPSADAAERILSEWPMFGGLPIRVVSVADTVRPWTTGIAPTMYQGVLDAYSAELRAAKVEHERIAADTVTRLGDRGRVAEAEVRDGNVAAEIIAIVDQQRADLAVLGSRGRTGLTRLLLGSVARNVLSGSTASVLIVRDGAKEQSRVGTAPG